MKRTIIAVALLAAFLLPTAAHAQGGIVYGEGIPLGTTVDHDVLLIGRNVYMAGTVNGNLFVLGNQVLVSGRVNGSLVMIAQNAAISGEVTGAVYASALTLDLPAMAALDRDLYALTVSLTSKPTSTVGRHLFALGLDAGLSGQVGGDLHTAIGPIQLYNGLMHLLGFDELMLELRFDTPPPAPLPQGSTVPVAPTKVHLRLKLQDAIPVFDWAAWGLNLLRSWGAPFILGLLGFWLLRKPLEASGTPLRARPWHTLGIGLLVLVVSLNLFLVGLLLMALIFAIGLGLNAIGLWQISLALWVVAFAALAVALTLLWLFIAYGSTILVSYHVISWLLQRFVRASSIWLDLLALLLGTLIFSLLRLIPYVGWAIALLVIAAGMGAAWLAWREAASAARTAGVEAAVVVPRAAPAKAGKK
jgi:hypothetical protein